MSKSKKLIFSFDQKALGKGEVVYCWQPGNKILAFCGDNRKISIVDKMGQKIKEFSLKASGKCKYMEFDNIDGDTLAVYQENFSQVSIFNIFTDKKLELEINRSNKDLPTCLRWSKTSANLFIGTKLGMIYFYNKKNDKLNPITMSHSAQIVTADWSEAGNLCTGDVKKKISVTTTKGDSLLQNMELNYEPKNIKWARQKTSDNSKDNNVISIIQDNKTILIYDMNQKKKPIELAMDKEYGNIVTYEWFGDGYIAIGFTKGYISIVSSHMDEVKNEVNSKQLFKNDLNDISVCDEVNRIAVAGENCIKIIDKNTFEEIPNEKIDIPKNAGSISKISWSKNGQILLVSTFGGNFYAFNVVINETFAVYGNMFATLLSINEVAAYILEDGKKKLLYNIQLSDEPETFQVSSNYLVASLGSKIEIFQTMDENEEILKNIKGVTKDFFSQISMLALNDNYLAVLCEGKAHLIDLKNDNTIKIFPLKDTEDVIYYICMTDDYFIYSDSNGRVKVFPIDNNCNCIADYKFDKIIKKIYPNNSGTKYICIDELGKIYVYSPVNETVLQLYDTLPGDFNRAIWDNEDSNVFIGINKSNTTAYTFNIILNSLNGPYIRTLKELYYLEDLEEEKMKKAKPITTNIDNDCYPFNLENGMLYYFNRAEKDVANQILDSHYWFYNWKKEGDSEDGHKKYYVQNYLLTNYKLCLDACKYLNEADQKLYYEKLGKETLNNLDIELAAEAFRYAKDISLVLTVEELKRETEKKVILGHIAAILGKEDLAVELFEGSSQPEKALELRIDLQDWEEALKLAKQYNKNKEPFISQKLAYKYETENHYQDAMSLYENSFIDNPLEYIKKINDDYDLNDLELHNQKCTAGISRCSFRNGETDKGLSKAEELTDKNLIIEIATLCESINYDLESAKLFSKVGLYEKAATIYIKMKMFSSAEGLMDKIKSPKLLSQLAKMKETEGLYSDAEKAYTAASDWENVIRINLKYLDNPDKAREILMNYCKTESAAILMSEYFESKGKKKETIEYKLIAKRYDEAFAIAQSYNEMKIYSDFMLKNSKNQEEFKKIASYYEGKSMYGEAGVFCEKIGDYQKALKMYIKGNKEEYFEKAIEMVGQNKDENLISELIDFFLVESKHPKAHHFLTKLYILLGNFKEACDIAISLASDEQKFSKYNEAHQILLDIYINLKEKNLPVSFDLNHRLGVLHSYRIAKRYIRLKKPMEAARNLLRVGNNITMFEEDKVKIMTTISLECQEAGLHKSSSTWAIELMKDYKASIPENYKNIISKISRKAYKNEDELMPINLPCPFCKKDVPEYDLKCNGCYNVIPFCIASGKHIVLKGLSKCPNCNFPCNIQEMKNLMVNDVKCPMCGGEVDPNLLQPLDDPIAYLKSRKVAEGGGNN